VIKNKYIILFLLTFVLTACGNDMDNQKNIDEAREVQRDENPKVITTVSKNIEAIYVGQNDNNSAELTIDGKQNTFQLGELNDNEINTLGKGDEVKISYMIKTEQVKDGEIKWAYLTEIEKVK
jgi:hypothetical protein